ncbi:MAG: phosphoglycolate phosphatase [Halorhodospira halophila]|uniref:phosphoglycolate phosphatase n=1 Tax=Halorhodospira TaxID=85108 RepID=UPI0019148F44|nr:MULTISPECIES: phosphoglycolate phosphatase [Halorhodospira]MBK5944396.1 phosphoglycolate phosphatase [Halorhodospira halophila]MCC3751326.1 phosphoglycolate phosphatase [Halorhodospira halophila]MCG5533665.1 phosphoglycolate phosphatase [Halorhodospira sp. 9621]
MDLSLTRAILFDLDGTLVDSAPDLTAAINQVLTERDRSPVTEEQVRGWVGNGARRLVARALTGEDDGTPPDEELDTALERFFECYGEAVYVHSRPFPGVVETVQALARAGMRLAVVTNKPRRFAEPILEGMGVADAIDVVVGGECTEARKPDPEPLRLAMERLGAASRTVLMVGDSSTDVEAAHNAGIPVVCVPYGYRRGVAPEDLGADAIVDDLSGVVTLLRGAA